MDKPLISVIVPVYNSIKYLEKCLNTLRYQTYDNIEVICVDDGSSDGSSGVLKWFGEKDSRFKVFKQQNSGVSSARNRGLEEAAGDYISFIDADDWVLLDLYDVFLNVLDKANRDIDIFMFNACFYNPRLSDLIEGRFFEYEDWQNHSFDYAIHTFDDCIRPFSRNLSVCNKIFRRGLIEENNIKFPDVKKYEDNYFWVTSALKAKSIVMTDNVYYRYRLDDKGSVSSLIMKQHVFDAFKILDMIENEIEKAGQYERYKYALFQYKYNLSVEAYTLCPAALKDEFYKEMKVRLIEAEKKDLDKKIYTQLTNYKLFEMIKSCSRSEFDALFVSKK